MRYIENYELREWVKDSLRKTIFQKAHALAIQTGCEILVKLEDNEDIKGSQYYATNTLESVFSGHGLRKKPEDMSVSGDTGLPIATLVDRAIQSAGDPSESTGSDLSSGGSQSVDDIVHRLSSSATASGDSAAVPMQLTFIKPHPQGESSPMQGTQTEPSLEQETSDVAEVTVKLEPMMDDEPPDPGPAEASNGDKIDTETQQAGENQMSFSLEDTSNQRILEMTPSGTSQEIIGGMTRDTKLYPVPISPKPYQCAVCHKAFRSVQVLQKHTQTFHMRPQAVLSKRGRGRGRGSYSRSSSFPHQYGNQAQSSRYLCVICSRVFRDTHLLEDHMARSHMGQTTSQASDSSFDNSSSDASQLAGLTGDLPFPLGDNSLTIQNPDDIPGPSSADGSSVPMSQMPAGSVVPFGQPQSSSVNAPFTQPPPPVYSGFAAPAAPLRTTTSMAGTSHQSGTPSRHASKNSNASVGKHKKQAMTMDDVNNSLVKQSNGDVSLNEGIKMALIPYAHKPKQVARLLADKLFTLSERVNSNCTGTRGQRKMDPIRLELLMSTVFDVCGIGYADQERAWKILRSAVDSANRNLRFVHRTFKDVKDV